MQRKHNVVNSLYLKPDELEVKNIERFERYKIVEENEPMWEEYMMEDAEYCVVAFGIASRVAKNAVAAARKEGIKVGLIRPITLWPFPTECKRPVTLCNRAGGMIPSPDEVLESIRKAWKGEC